MLLKPAVVATAFSPAHSAVTFAAAVYGVAIGLAHEDGNSLPRSDNIIVAKHVDSFPGLGGSWGPSSSLRRPPIEGNEPARRDDVYDVESEDIDALP